MLPLAFSSHVRGVSKVGVVRSLIEQVLSLGFRIRTVATGSGFYSAGAARYLSRFKFISAVPAGDIRIHGEFGVQRALQDEGQEDGQGARLR
jgi:putative transposase